MIDMKKTIIFCAAALVAVACETEDFHSSYTPNAEGYELATATTAMIRNDAGRAKWTTVEAVTKDTTVQFHVELSKALSGSLTVNLEVGDAALVSDYNSENGTEYTAIEDSLVTIGSAATVSSGSKVSGEIPVTVKIDESLSTDKVYAIPLVVSSNNAGVKEGSVHLLLIKNMNGVKMSAEKSTGIKLFSCMETGTANPLFHLSFTLKNSGKPLFDYVIIFSSHIAYDETLGKCVIDPNTCQAAINGNYEKYIKPLHDKGIKVLLSLLGSSTAGVAHLDDATAKLFAREVADYCRAYHLDGVFLDDEYTGSLSRPGFVSGSSTHAARLCYEIKKAMPDKAVVTYIYSRMYGFTTVDGVEAGEFIDYALNDYGRTIGTSAYQGIKASQIGIYSTNFAPAYSSYQATATKLKYLRNNGYGAYMAYCLDFNISTWSKQLQQLKNIATYLYDDELVDSNYRPTPEW